MTPQYLGHPAHCTNYVALCVIHKAHCVKRGCPSLSYVGAPLRTLFMLVGPRRTRARESRFPFPPAPSGAPTSALYRAGNLALSAPHRGPDPGLCLSHPNTLLRFGTSFRLAGIDSLRPRFVPFLKLTLGARIFTFSRTSVSSHVKDTDSSFGSRRGWVLRRSASSSYSTSIPITCVLITRNFVPWRGLVFTSAHISSVPLWWTSSSSWATLSVIRKKTVLDVLAVLSCRHPSILGEQDGRFVVLV